MESFGFSLYSFRLYLSFGVFEVFCFSWTALLQLFFLDARRNVFEHESLGCELFNVIDGSPLHGEPKQLTPSAATKQGLIGRLIMAPCIALSTCSIN